MFDRFALLLLLACASCTSVQDQNENNQVVFAASYRCGDEVNSLLDSEVELIPNPSQNLPPPVEFDGWPELFEPFQIYSDREVAQFVPFGSYAFRGAGARIVVTGFDGNCGLGFKSETLSVEPFGFASGSTEFQDIFVDKSILKFLRTDGPESEAALLRGILITAKFASIPGGYPVDNAKFLVLDGRIIGTSLRLPSNMPTPVQIDGLGE